MSDDRTYTGRLTLRKATKEDTRVLYEWRNDPLTKENSIDSKPVGWDVHVEWVKRTLQGDVAGRTLYIAETDGCPVGTVRTDEGEDGYTEISYTVAPAWRGRGLGKDMVLLCAHTAVRGKKLRARIKKGHGPSEAIAAALGLAPVFEEASADPSDTRPVVEWR